jgi:predicted nuclease of predicted toxin-antitoxin system
LAKVEGRILITIDKDFGEIVFLQKSLSLGIILLRIKGQKVEVKLKLIKELFQNYRNKLLNNFVIITDKKLRFIPLEDER